METAHQETFSYKFLAAQVDFSIFYEFFKIVAERR